MGLGDVEDADARTKSIHIIAIGGTGVAPLACLLKQEGYQVRGSDLPLYPPMSDLLEREGLRPLESDSTPATSIRVPTW